MKFCIGVEGILEKIQQFKNNADVWNIIPYVCIQPNIRDNTEVKIVCFNGKAIVKNLHKKGRKGSRSPFRGITLRKLFDFAEEVIAVLRLHCPEIVTDQVIRVDIFGFIGHPGKFIVNELEGYEAQKTGSGLGGSDKCGTINVKVADYWEEIICECIEFHLAHRDDAL